MAETWIRVSVKTYFVELSQILIGIGTLKEVKKIGFFIKQCLIYCLI